MLTQRRVVGMRSFMLLRHDKCSLFGLFTRSSHAYGIAGCLALAVVAPSRALTLDPPAVDGSEEAEVAASGDRANINRSASDLVDLTEDIRRLLVMGSAPTVRRSGVRTLDLTSEDLVWITEKAESTSDVSIKRFASKLVIVDWLVKMGQSDLASPQGRRLNEAGPLIGELAVSAFLHAAAGGEVLTLDEFRVGPGRSVTKWMSDTRTRHIVSVLLNVEAIVEYEHLVRAAQAIVESSTRVGESLPKIEGLQVAHLDQINIGDGPMLAQGAQLWNRSSLPLTDVFIVVESETRGVRVDLNKGQREIIDMNIMMGEEEIDSIRVYFMVENLQATTPVIMYALVERLEPDEIVKVVLPDTIPHFNLVRTTVRVVCDQGVMDLTPVLENGESVSFPKRVRSRRSTAPQAVADPEVEAGRLLTMYANYEANGKGIEGSPLLRRIEEEYPQTQAALRAKEILERIEQSKSPK